MRVLLILVSIVLVLKCDGYKILGMFPVPSISHQVAFRPLMQELARRGHQVVMITPDPEFIKGKSPSNYTEIDVHDKSYEIWRNGFVKAVDGIAKNKFHMVTVALTNMVEIFECQLKNPEVSKALDPRNEYDLIIVEALAKPALVLSHIFKKPIIQFSSFGSLYPNYEVVGSPSHPIFYPSIIADKLNNLNVMDKIYRIYDDYKLESIVKDIEIEENALLKRMYGDNTPTIKELSDNVGMLFLNIHPIWEGNRAVPPSVIHLGGMHIKPPKELPKDLKAYLDASKHGVIYMSFGTNVDPTTLPLERINIFCNVFSKLPYDVIWKWNGDTLPGKPDNVRIEKWLPQMDLLRHPKLKLFITQAGLQSTDEAISAGVPVIAFPMLGDQWYNAEKYVHHGIGLSLDVNKVTEESFMDAVKTVIGDERYRNSMIRLRTTMQERPMTPLQLAVYWSELVAKRGARHLRSNLANVSFWDYYVLDVVLELAKVFILLLVLLTIFVIFVKKVLFKLKGKVKDD